MGEIVALPDVRLERRAPSDGGEARIVDGLNKRIYGRGSRISVLNPCCASAPLMRERR